MCTCIKLDNNNINLFGRNMDIYESFNEQIIITPRNYNIKYKNIPSNNNHYSIIGIGTIIDNYPLYADAVNEYGLGVAALNFKTYAKYNNPSNKINIAPYELPLYIYYLNINQLKN